MGGSVSAGHSNAELVYNLSTQHAASRSSLVEQLMLGVDRRAYFLPDFEHFAYQDLAWKHNLIHLSAPVIYWEVLDQLQLKPGLSFLNLGSGTGYLSTMAGLILGPNGINHGVELHQEVIDFAVDKLEHFKQESESMDRYEFCEPQFVQGNCLYLPPDVRQYDRVYVGAACPEDKENYMKNLLKVGGILVMPFRDYLVQIKRVGTNQFKTTRSMQVAFSSLQDPPVESGAAPVPHTKLPELHPRDLRDLARCRIRQLLRKCCETECPEVVQLKRFIPKRDVRSRLRVCSSNPGDMHQIISVGYSEQTDDDDENDNNMSDNQSLEDHQHDHDDDDIDEVGTLDPPTDSEASNDETNQQTKETTRDGKHQRNRETSLDGKNQQTKRTSREREGKEENDKDEKLELEEKLENVLKVSKKEQDKEETDEGGTRNSGKSEEKRNRSKQMDREKERPSKRSAGCSTDNGACSSSKNLYRKSTSPRSSNSSNVQKYVDKEPLTKLESARKFKQLLDDLTENRCPGSSRNNEARDESSCDKLDSVVNDKSDDGIQDAMKSGLESNDDNRMTASETEIDEIGNFIDANEPKKQTDIEEKTNNLVGVENENFDVDNSAKSLKNSHGANENVNQDAAGNANTNLVEDSNEESEMIVKLCNNDEEEPMDGVNDDVQDNNERKSDNKSASNECINAKHLMDTNEPMASKEKITPSTSSISFKREKTDSGVVDDDFVGDNNSNASLDSSGGSLDSGISYHSALNAYMESVREMKRTYANRHKAQNSFLKCLMDSARDGENNQDGENVRKKTLGELFGDGACTFGDSSSSYAKTSAPSGNSKTNMVNTNSLSDTANKAGLSESLDSCNATNNVSTNGASKDILDEIMESEDQTQACSSKHTYQNENKTDKHGESSGASDIRGESSGTSDLRGESSGTSDLRGESSSTSDLRGESSSTIHADCNKESKNDHRHDSDVSRSKKNKSYPNKDNNSHTSRYGNSSEEKENSTEEKLPYPTYAELQAMRQKLLAKIRDRSRATSPNDSSESDVEPYLSNGRFENLQGESRFPDQSKSSGQNKNYNREQTKPSGRNKNYNSGTRRQDRNKPSGSKTNSESKPNSSEDTRMSEDGEDDIDGETYESKRKYTTDSEHGDDESESNDDQGKKESSKKNKKFKERNTEEEESRRQVTIEAERLARAAQAAQRRDGLLNFLDEPPPARPLFHVFNRGIFEVMSPLRREAYNEEEVISDDDEDFILKDLDKEEEEEEEEVDDGRPTYTSLMKEKIQALPLPNLVKRYLNYERDF